MQTKSLVFSNPLLRDRVEVVSQTQDCLVLKTTLQPLSGQYACHYHSYTTESFTVLSGVLHVWVNGESIKLTAGQTAKVRPFEAHRFFNTDSDQLVVFQVTVTPAKQFKHGLQIFYGLAIDGKTFENCLPKNPLYAAVGLQMMDAYSADTLMPYRLQKAGIMLLAKLAHFLGLARKLKVRYC